MGGCSCTFSLLYLVGSVSTGLFVRFTQCREVIAEWEKIIGGGGRAGGRGSRKEDTEIEKEEE